MALHGTVGAFDGGLDDWTSYTERLQQYFADNDVIDAAKQRAILLSVCRPTAYKTIRNLVSPGKPTDKSFVIVQRLKFNTFVHRSGQTVAAFIAELRRLMEHCDFGATLDDRHQ